MRSCHSTSQKGQSRAVANSLAVQRNCINLASEFVDNRSESIAQRKLQETMNSRSLVVNPAQRHAATNIQPDRILQRKETVKGETKNKESKKSGKDSKKVKTREELLTELKLTIKELLNVRKSCQKEYFQKKDENRALILKLFRKEGPKKKLRTTRRRLRRLEEKFLDQCKDNEKLLTETRSSYYKLRPKAKGYKKIEESARCQSIKRTADNARIQAVKAVDAYSEILLEIARTQEALYNKDCRKAKKK